VGCEMWVERGVRYGGGVGGREINE